MKWYLALISSLLVLAFSTGYLALSLREGHQASSEDIKRIEHLKRVFQANVEPLVIINFNSLYYSDEHFLLIDPKFKLSGSVIENDKRFSSSQDCYISLPSQINAENFQKVALWESFRCGDLDSLPSQFFAGAPYLHPSRKSFAFLAFQTGMPQFTNINWISKNLSYFHLSELPYVRRVVGDFPGLFSFLSRFSEEDLQSLSKGEGTILTEDFLLARIKYPSIISILEYRWYSRSELRRFLEGSPFRVSKYGVDKRCFYRDGILCWEYQTKHVLGMLNKRTLLLFAGLLFVCVLGVWLFWSRLRSEKTEDERRRLALRVLTHEFRTPISSLLLLVEDMGKGFERLDPEHQDNYLRMSSEIHRLRRLTEASKHYLSVKNKDKLLTMKEEFIPSYKDFFEEIIDPYLYEHEEGSFILELPEEDFSLCLDTYWFRICFKNLIDNAIAHGKKPYTITNIKSENWFSIEVRDEGENPFETLGQMTDEFVKGEKSSGSGLGLNIVSKVIKEMGGKFEYSSNPTRFKIQLKINKKRGNNESDFISRG